MGHINILAIHVGHNSTAGLLQDGKITALVNEERFTRIKNYAGFPELSIKWLLNFANITAEDLNAVAICGEKLVLPVVSTVSGSKKLNLISKVYGFLEYNAGPLYLPLFKTKNLFYDKPIDKIVIAKLYEKLRSLNISKEKIIFVDHHLCHSYSAYYGQTIKRKKELVLTLDGEGDDSCSTVNIAEGYSLNKIASTWRHYSLGYIYSLTTGFLGMTPLEHEYKVMGLAPYSTQKEQKYFMKTYDKVFKDVIWLDKKNPLTFKSAFPLNRFDKWLYSRAIGERFDNMAGAVQYLTEELVKKWVSAAVKKTELNEIYAGGGVFMNVKMNMALADLPEIEKVSILPSCGDESNPIGAAYYVYLKLCKEQGYKPTIQPIKDLYLGPDYDEEVEEYIRKEKLNAKYNIQTADARLIAEMLSKGEIIARCAGRMEWGARSLGNRAILANPSDLKYVWQINEQIKMRDFWMPFAPTILKEREHDYIENSKNIEAPYMIMAFRSTPLSRKELRAAMHQADFTLRPQMLQEDWNPEYYSIIKEFENLTGIGGVLNTSFNLHGKPIVASPQDAVKETFENSGLKHLLLGKYLISKK